MDLLISNAKSAPSFCSDRLWAAISITTHQNRFVTLPEANRVALLQQWYADISGGHAVPGQRAYSAELARELAQFVLDLKGKAEVLLVHCEAGLSRSPGVAMALAYLSECAESVRSINLNHYPNALVRDLTLDALRGACVERRACLTGWFRFAGQVQKFKDGTFLLSPEYLNQTSDPNLDVRVARTPVEQLMCLEALPRATWGYCSCQRAFASACPA
jgi:predicted protein tyrosine phosphatase